MAKPRLRKCVVSFCVQEIPLWLHFCARCYRLVPKYLKDGIHAEYRNMKLSGTRHSQEQDELVRQAVAAIEAKRARAGSKRRGGDLYRQAGAVQ